ncbi:MAG TPA: 6-carboxytetrahydropterin synthase QueD [Planctomycetota bacterium]|nr:6-carboxytetrahydropterin synthase QueD [Planctomycetota bacterium]
MPVEPGTALFVSKDFTFDAAHNLPRYVGKCERLHGHTFKLRVTVKAPLDTWSGMAFDFNALKKAVSERVVAILDHSYVNEIVPNPSAEFIAIWVWRRLSDLPLFEIKVWETPTSFVTYQGPPRVGEPGSPPRHGAA